MLSKPEKPVSKKEKDHAQKVFSILRKEYPDPKPALNYKTAFQLLIATILAAQCTDARVNIVTIDLFKKYKRPQDYVDVSPEELEQDIRTTGFYRAKARSIKQCCQQLIERHKGKVPEDFDELNKLTGVGRKTASVVAGNAFGIPSVAVDTHVLRLSNRLGFIDSGDAVKIEFRMKELLPENDWVNSSHWLQTHGRKICIARKPKCLQCVVGNICPSFNPANG
jgi:endonuclease-3